MPAAIVNGNPESAAIWEPLLAELDRSDVLLLSPGRRTDRPERVRLGTAWGPGCRSGRLVLSTRASRGEAG
jgi:hypothetical protein